MSMTPTTACHTDADADESTPRRDVIYFGNDWSAENRTSSHHIARRLAKRHRVFYLECPGMRAPTGSGRDLKKVFAKLWMFLRGVRPTNEGLKVRTLLQLPFHRFGLVRRLNRLIVKGTVRWLMWREGVRDPITWFHVPHMPFLVGDLGEMLSVYYCIDDYAAYPGANHAAVRAMDDETTRRADLVFIASDTLLDHKLTLNPETRVSPHGVDVEHFGRAQAAGTDVPADTAHLRGPVVGYFGLIEKFTDLDLIKYLAEQRPQWTFLMIGRVAVPETEVPQLPNVHLVGKRPYEQLPAYGKQFDVSIIPFRTGAWSYHANPLKLREYLAMGKPVVAVSTPQIDKYADVVGVAHSREEFLAKLDAAMAGPPPAAETRARQARVAGESWDARVRQVFEVIEQQLEAAADKPELAAAAAPG